MHSCATLLSDAIGPQAVSFLGPNELQALILVTDQPEASTMSARGFGVSAATQEASTVTSC